MLDLVGELRRVVSKLVITFAGAPDGWDCSPELDGQLLAASCHGQDSTCCDSQ
jgi:hypothetical protein